MFLKKLIYVVKSNYFKITPLSTSVFFISQISIMHKYTETESKNTGKIGTHSMWEQMYIILWVKNDAKQSEAKKFWNLKK